MVGGEWLVMVEQADCPLLKEMRNENLKTPFGSKAATSPTYVVADLLDTSPKS